MSRSCSSVDVTYFVVLHINTPYLMRIIFEVYSTYDLHVAYQSPLLIPFGHYITMSYIYSFQGVEITGNTHYLGIVFITFQNC